MSVVLWFACLSSLEAAPKSLSYGSKESLRLAVEDLIQTYGDQYPKGPSYLRRLETVSSEVELARLRKEALMDNPLVDFDQMIVVERSGSTRWLPENYQSNASLPKKGHQNRVASLSLNDGELKTIYQPEGGQFVGDLELHFDADRLMFSSIGEHHAWAVLELDLGKEMSKPRQLTPAISDIDCMDPCYLPDGRIIFASTSSFQGVPCNNGDDYVALLHLMDLETSQVRQLCFDQDNSWHPTVLPNGKVLYLRWEYTDSAHYFSRILMHMNPDGTNQKEFYGSNSYWPNSLFFARPIPGSSNKFISIVCGHHGIRRAGELVLFDNNKGRFEADGVIQRIPGRGKIVKPVYKDFLVNDSFPLFLHPYPLSEKHFLVSMSLDKKHYGLYLVDVYDNIVPIKVVPGKSIVEAIPLRKTPKPPLKPDLVRLEQKEATFYIQDIYEGPGLRGVPRGSVKRLKVYTYEYAPRRQGSHQAIGIEGPWDVRTVLGTVPVHADGSVMFKAPANTPIAFLPLDKEGKAMQLMRSWTVGMPGEVVSCIGCHESQNTAPKPKPTMASSMQPLAIEPWLGEKPRGFSFKREVQPVLDQFCVGCHTTELAKKDGRPDFQDMQKSYYELHPYVRRNGPEGDYHMLTPLEFHADTSELVQILQQGHYHVKLDDKAWEKLITWIDMNVPQHGTWTEAPKNKNYDASGYLARREETRREYANVDIQPEVVHSPYLKRKAFEAPDVPETHEVEVETLDAWPLAAEKARAMQDDKPPVELDLGNGQKMKFVYVPRGEYINATGKKVAIDKAFWMSETEVTFAQYQRFNPKHLNGVYDMHWKDQCDRGYYMNDPAFPVIRASWHDAQKFCAWLEQQSGKTIRLPDAAQWEWACRAGSDSPMNYGDTTSDFGNHANLADVQLKKMAVYGIDPKPVRNPSPRMDFIPKRTDVDDGVLHLAKVGTYQANLWGLFDMHGNVAEWVSTRGADGKKQVLGGSWRDRPHRAAAGYALEFPAWQKVYNVGFRVIIEE
ncbi:SUMF1/EgtB/PvdO family nonheme iron enzyme [Verrucomicrobiaceae bacterium N1E253]|uniref:SUMF1/EgtB/PvdO family nonheme iron enzyme n=1 Tax=Oceaniferula marina TaxID=2748318 RepID=A0A851GG97_9BACT|nr:SUMF1/EgtB/PvdO family nonheme iron enzyme [Oceaniferula marina]